VLRNRDLPPGLPERLHPSAKRIEARPREITGNELFTGHAGNADPVLFGWYDGHLSAPPGE